MIRTSGRRLAPVGVAIIVTIACNVAADAQDRVRWKMQSAFTSSLVHLAPPVSASPRTSSACRAATSRSSGEPGALVPALSKPMRRPRVRLRPAGLRRGTTPARSSRWLSSTTVPFGPQYGEFFAWKKFHGGDELKNEIYAEHGLYSIDVFSIGPETSGWFRNEITSLNQLKGLKMRFFGLGAQVMTRRSACRPSCLLAPTSIRLLERGVIDATGA